MNRLRASYRRLMGRDRAAGVAQSNEVELLAGLLRDLRVPHTFCEFGFDAREFNCAGLVDAGWHGLLIDGDAAKVNEAQANFGSGARWWVTVVRRLLGARRVTVLCKLLDRENVRTTIAGYYPPRKLGVLSVDVDGNDYWLLSELFSLAPGLIVCEYNASFLMHPVTVPYDPMFDRHAKHERGFYHGASLSALTKLCAAHDYDLVAVSEAGLNAVFRRRDLAPGGRSLDPSLAYRENAFRNQWHGLTADQQWESLSCLPLVRV